MSWLVPFFVFVVWMAGQLICLIFDGTWIGTRELAVINPLVVFRSPQELQTFGAVTNPLTVFSDALPTMLMWDYSYFTGVWELIRYVLLFGFTIAFVYGLLQTFIPSLRLFGR